MTSVRHFRWALLLSSMFLTVAAGSPKRSNVDGARIAAADRDPGNWLSTGRGYDEQRYSPLTTIDADNVSQLGLAWSVKLDVDRGDGGDSDRRRRCDVHDGRV